MELMKASNEWMSRPDDERFTSLTSMLEHFGTQRQRSRELVISTRQIEAIPEPDNKGLLIQRTGGAVPYAPTHWSFGQLATLAGAPSGYLRTLPAPMAADCINYGLKYTRDIEDCGLLLENNGANRLRAATGPRYGRIWNHDIVRTLVDRFGDGVTGDWRVPGEFGKRVEVTKRNTTLYAGDRDMFVFLADEDHRVELPNRRNGQPGSLARGFFTWNSEVAASVFGLGT